MYKQKQKNAQMPAFGWLFSVIIGAFILFFAFLFVFRFTHIAEQQEQAVTTTSLDILLEPFASSIATGQSDIITLPRNSKLEIDCSYSDFDFGKNIVKYSTTGQFRFSKVVRDKYIFARPIQKRNILVVVLPFEMPFRIADLTLLIGHDYCFVGLPERYKDLLQELTETNADAANIRLEFFSDVNDCSEDSIKVCKDNLNCDVSFTCADGCSYGTISYGNNDKQYLWYGNLLLAAAFSEPELYECNANRLLKRAKLIASIYKTEASMLSSKGCSSISGLSSQLDRYITQLNNIDISDTSTSSFASLHDTAKTIDHINGFALCKIY